MYDDPIPRWAQITIYCAASFLGGMTAIFLMTPVVTICEAPGVTVQCVRTWIDALSGWAAVAAGGVTIFFLYRQIRQSNRQAEIALIDPLNEEAEQLRKERAILTGIEKELQLFRKHSPFVDAQFFHHQFDLPAGKPAKEIKELSRLRYGLQNLDRAISECLTEIEDFDRHGLNRAAMSTRWALIDHKPESDQAMVRILAVLNREFPAASPSKQPNAKIRAINTIDDRNVDIDVNVEPYASWMLFVEGLRAGTGEGADELRIIGIIVGLISRHAMALEDRVHQNRARIDQTRRNADI